MSLSFFDLNHEGRGTFVTTRDTGTGTGAGTKVLPGVLTLNPTWYCFLVLSVLFC